jgi:hypothetical protein
MADTDGGGGGTETTYKLLYEHQSICPRFLKKGQQMGSAGLSVSSHPVT